MFKEKMKAAMAMLLLGAAILLTSVPVLAATRLEIAVSKNSLNVGDSVVVTVYSKDENGQDVNADMTITYDTSILEYVGSSANSANNAGGGKITAVGSEIEYTFKAIGSGTAAITAGASGVETQGVKLPVGGTTADPTTEEPSTPTAEDPKEETPVEETEEPEEENNDGSVTSASVTTSKTEGNSVLRSDTEEELEEVSIKEGLELADNINAHVKETTGVKAVVNGVTYEISCSLSKDDIPEGFLVKNISYNGQKLAGVKSFNGYIYMFYLVNPEDENDQGFFVYEPDTNYFYPFIRIYAGKHRIQVMNPVDIVVIPEGFTKVVMNYNNKKFTAYRCDQNQEFFAFYGADTTGVTAWYQFDNSQLTMQRLNTVTVYPETNEEDEAAFEALNEAYDTLSDQYVNEKNSYISTVAILVFVIAFLVVVAVNLILRCREIRKMYEEAEDVEYIDADDDRYVPVSVERKNENVVREEHKKKDNLGFVEEQYNRMRRTEESPRSEVIHKREAAPVPVMAVKEEEIKADDINIDDIKIAEIDPFEDEEPVKETTVEKTAPVVEEQPKKRLFGKFAKPVEDEDDDFDDDFDDFDDEEEIIPKKKERKMPSQDMNIAVRESVMMNSGESLIGRKEKTPEFKSSDDDDDLEFLDI